MGRNSLDKFLKVLNHKHAYTLNRLKNSYSVIFIISFILAALFYLPTLHSKFEYDINSHIIDFEHYGFSGFWSCWGEKTIRWGINCVEFTIWRIFGPNDVVWFTICVGLHALCATLLYALVRYFLQRIAFSYSVSAALISGLLFLLSPYHTETIVWGATLFYMAYTATFLGIMLCFVLYTQNPKTKYIILLYLLLAYDLVTFEEFFITPLVFVVLYFLLKYTGNLSLSFKRILALFVLPSAGFIGFYFLWNLARIGKIVGHYGPEVHFHFDFWMLTANFTKYLLKFSYLHLFLSYAKIGKIYNHLTHHKLLIILSGLYTVTFATAFILVLKRKVAPALVIVIAFFALFVITLLPVLNLYLPFNKDIEQERYLYVPALFFYPFITIALLQVFKKAAVPWLAAALAISVFFLHRNVLSWQWVGQTDNGLVNDFRWPQAKRIFILLNADNCNGAYMMRDMPQSGFAEMLHVKRRIDIAQKSHDILQYNILTPLDSCYAEIADSNTIKITFGQWGNWFWYKSVGASSYDSTLYNVKIDDWGHSFTVRFKEKRPGDVYIYQCRDKWIEVKGF